MKISKVKTAIKVANVVKRTDDSNNKIKMAWNENLSKELLKDNSGRVYIITSNKDIKKVGGSQCKGGIKGTWQPYCGGMGGSPSVRTYGIHILIAEELDKGNEVEVYMIQSPKVFAQVSGLFDNTTTEVSAFKEMEAKCLSDYYNLEKKYPDWNFQEANNPWPLYIQEGCNLLNIKTTNNSKRNK
jgi:hypothetical protein